MNNAVKAILNEYENRRNRAFADAESRKRDAYSRIPELESIDEEISRFGLKYGRDVLVSADDSASLHLKSLASALDELKNRKKSLLKKAGLPEDYYAVRYSCPVCRDTGYTGDISSPERCACFRQQLINAAYSQSNIAAIELENFDSFNEALFSVVADEKTHGTKLSPRENILDIRDRCLKFIETFDQPGGNSLCFIGQAGTGKTFMCSCIAKELIGMGKTVLYQTSPMLFNIINEYKFRSFNNGNGSENNIYRDIFNADLLIIDDLGAEPASQSRYSDLFTIINTRILNNVKKSCRTIISTNLGPKEILETYTDRVASRIIGHFDVYKFIGEDIRKIKKSLS